MQLVLRIAATDPALAETFPGVGTVATDRTLTIGRAADNGLVLIDRDRTISKHHCVIAPTPDGYELTDTSRNGTFLNNDPQALTREVATKLKTGDVVTLSCFLLTVVAAGEQPAFAGDAELPEAERSPAAPREITNARMGAPDRPRNPSVDDFWGPEPGLVSGLGAHDLDEHGLDALDLGQRKVTRPAATVFPTAYHRAPAEAAAFVQPKLRRESIPDDWDLVRELGKSRQVPDGAALPQQPVIAVDHRVAPLVPKVEREVELSAERQSAVGEPTATTAIEAFLDAVGLSMADAKEVGLAALLGRAGTSLRVTAGCLQDILSARAMAKRGFGVEQTLVEASGNNLLKVVGNSDEAVRALLLTEMPGFLVGAAMIEKAFDDIKRHQIAMLKALRAALASVCQQLGPAAIEATVGAPRFWERALPISRPARCWEHYKTVFDDVTAGLDNDAARIFGGEFLRAYRDTTQDSPPEGETDVA